MTSLYDLLESEASRHEPNPDALSCVLERTSRRRRRRHVGRVSCALAVAVALVAVGLAVAHQQQSTRTNVVTLPRAVTARVDIAVGSATDVALDPEGDGWVTGSGFVTRIDGRTATVTAKIPVPGNSDYRYVVVGEGSVWVSDTGTGDVTRIDPRTNTVQATIPTRSAPVSLVVAFGTLWVLDAGGRSGDQAVVPIDVRTNRAGLRIPVRAQKLVVGPREILAAGGAEDGSAYAIEPTTHAVRVIRDPLGAEPFFLWGSPTGMWAMEANGLQRVDPDSLARIGSAMSIHPGPLAVTPDALWLLEQVTSTGPSELQEIDPGRPARIGAPIIVGRTAVAVAATSDQVWVANFGDGTVTVLTLGTP